MAIPITTALGAVDLTQYGYDIIMVDYRGYGKSGGEPSGDYV